eukprot:9053645-Pyramimonas_sp.AAC.1
MLLANRYAIRFGLRQLVFYPEYGAQIHPLSRTQERVNAAVERGGSTCGGIVFFWCVPKDSVVESSESGIAIGVSTDPLSRR